MRGNRASGFSGQADIHHIPSNDYDGIFVNARHDRATAQTRGLIELTHMRAATRARHPLPKIQHPAPASILNQISRPLGNLEASVRSRNAIADDGRARDRGTPRGYGDCSLSPKSDSVQREPALAPETAGRTVLRPSQPHQQSAADAFIPAEAVA